MTRSGQGRTFWWVNVGGLGGRGTAFRWRAYAESIAHVVHSGSILHYSRRGMRTGCTSTLCVAHFRAHSSVREAAVLSQGGSSKLYL